MNKKMAFCAAVALAATLVGTSHAQLHAIRPEQARGQDGYTRYQGKVLSVEQAAPIAFSTSYLRVGGKVYYYFCGYLYQVGNVAPGDAPARLPVTDAVFDLPSAS